MKKVMLIFPPEWVPTAPYLALPSLTAVLRQNGIETVQKDISVEAFDHYFTKEFIEFIGTRIESRLKELRADNLTVGIHSVISTHNVHEFPAIADQLMALGPDQYIAEPAEEREELQTMNTGITPTPDDFDIAIGHLEKRLERQRDDGLSALTRAIRLVYYRFARASLHSGEQVIPCYAAIASAHIAATGDV